MMGGSSASAILGSRCGVVDRRAFKVRMPSLSLLPSVDVEPARRLSRPTSRRRSRPGRPAGHGVEVKLTEFKPSAVFPRRPLRRCPWRRLLRWEQW